MKRNNKDEELRTIAKIVDIRSKLHYRIFEMLQNCDKDCHVFRPPCSNRYSHSSKVIVRVQDEEASEQLRNDIENAINTTNTDIKRLQKQISINNFTPIKYKIKTIRATDKVQYTISQAKRSHAVSSDAVKNLLKKVISKYDEESDAELKDLKVLPMEVEYIINDKINFKERMEQKIEEIDPNKEYRFIELTGRAIRITYYDVEDFRRKQINLGNILIVICENDCEIVSSPMRKIRTDNDEIFYAQDNWEITVK